jgi:hypothetical protein
MTQKVVWGIGLLYRRLRWLLRSHGVMLRLARRDTPGWIVVWEGRKRNKFRAWREMTHSPD